MSGNWLAVTERHNKAEGIVLNMKYFQYLSLLFTEIYPGKIVLLTPNEDLSRQHLAELPLLVMSN